MHIFFDVDKTLIEPVARSLRPHAKEVIDKLRRDGHYVYLWSGRERPNCQDVILRYNLDVEGYFDKPEELTPEGMREANIYFRPEFCIDDEDEHLINEFGGYKIKPYTLTDEEDEELQKVYERIPKAI